MNAPSSKLAFNKSLDLWEKSKESLIQGGSTISKHAKLYTQGAYPIYIKSAKGAKVIDIDGNEFLDFQSSLGAIILGHQYPAINKVIEKQLSKGILFSLANPDAVLLAEKLCKHIPSSEKVRLLKNGSDATSAAVRIAKAYTKKKKILFCHYHGWHDWYYVATSMNRGISEELKKDIINLPYNDLDALDKIISDYKDQIAAVIMEPVHLEDPHTGFLEKVRKITEENNILLIFDEVVTGFRFGLGGAQKKLNITPDLSCFAKALGNGMPISAVVGKRKIMDETEDVVTSMTYGEEALSITVALEIINILEHEPVEGHIWRLGKIFKEEFNKLALLYNVPIECVGFPVRLEFTFNDYGQNSRKALKTFFLQETIQRNILFGNVLFMTYSHSDKDIQKALKVCEEVLCLIHSSEGEKLNLIGKETVELW